MKPSNFQLSLLFLFSFILVSLLTPLMRIVAIKLNIVDLPNANHKTHREPVPYLGGIAILIGILATSVSALVIESQNQMIIWTAMSVLGPATFMGIIGLVDDIKSLSPWPRFLAQNIVAIFSAIILISTKTLGSPTGNALLDIFLTIFWIVGITNSINFLDNIDGGASGVIAISSFCLFLLSYQGGQFLISSLAIVITGATLGFLLWNQPPARIYMGDAGALFLGLLMATLTVRLDTNPINRTAGFLVPVLVLAVPILDTTVAVVSRIFRGVSPFQGGRDHISHRLMSRGLGKKQSLSLIWIMTLLFCIGAGVLSNIEYKYEGFAAGALIMIYSLLMATFLFYVRQ